MQRHAGALVADSSGNAGSAIAAYAARAGLPCTVFVPEHTSAGKQRQIRAYGAALELVPGDRTATTQAAIDAVSATGAMYASHIYDPYFLQGTKTYAFELWEQLDAGPDALILPVGNGTLLLGAARGFRELHAAGLMDHAPALIGVQSERCAPLASAWAAGATQPAQIEARPTVAEGIAIPRPPRGAQILAAVRASGGCIVEVPEEAVGPRADRVGRPRAVRRADRGAHVGCGAAGARPPGTRGHRRARRRVGARTGARLRQRGGAAVRLGAEIEIALTGA